MNKYQRNESDAPTGTTTVGLSVPVLAVADVMKGEPGAGRGGDGGGGRGSEVDASKYSE